MRDPRADAVPLVNGGGARRCLVVRGDEREGTVELRWQPDGPACTASVTLTEEGTAGERYATSFELGPNSAVVHRYNGALTVTGTAVGGNGVLHVRTLEGGREKLTPPASLELTIGPGATVSAGWRSPHRPLVTWYREVDVLTAAFFNLAGGNVGQLPAATELPHPPAHELRVTNPDVAPRRAVIVWR